MNLPSKILSDAVNEIAKLPGIGKKSALRMVLYILKQDPHFAESLATSIVKLRNETHACQTCFNIADEKSCSVCLQRTRDRETICVVEQVADLLAVENTSQYNGLYHVLGGVISPIHGIGPSNINLDSLLHRVQQGEIKEIILALSSTMEADTTAFYITKKLSAYPVKVSTIARGVPAGSEIEYTDEITLGRSITGRLAYSVAADDAR
jgi:recombination protein RecR